MFRRIRRAALIQASLAAALVFCGLAASARADTVEFLSGAKVQGKVTAKDDKSITVVVMLGGKEFTRKYPLKDLHQVLIGEKRYVINEKGAADNGGARPASNKTEPADDSASPASGLRSKAEVEALIRSEGATPPDWFDATPLDYPSTLDLTWPEPAPPGWNNQRNVGQYVWDVINPNPGKWREGVKLMHHILSISKDNPAVQARAMDQLGRMYHDLHQDYARAAFWWRRAGVGDPTTKHEGHYVHLAECYFRLGNKAMAVEAMSRAPGTFAAVKAWADMGELKKALELAERWATTSSAPEYALLHGGDACRTVGRYPEAMAYYRRVLALSPAASKNANRLKNMQERAKASLEAIQLFELTDVKKVADGAYTASSRGYEDQVHVEVTVRGGKLEAVRVTQHREKQYYSSIADTPAKIVARQGVKGVDATSGATITSEAIINAAAKALASGK